MKNLSNLPKNNNNNKTTISYKISETNSTFRAKERTTEKV